MELQKQGFEYVTISDVIKWIRDIQWENKIKKYDK